MNANKSLDENMLTINHDMEVFKSKLYDVQKNDYKDKDCNETTVKQDIGQYIKDNLDHISEGMKSLHHAGDEKIKEIYKKEPSMKQEVALNLTGVFMLSKDLMVAS